MSEPPKITGFQRFDVRVDAEIRRREVEAELRELGDRLYLSDEDVERKAALVEELRELTVVSQR